MMWWPYGTVTGWWTLAWMALFWDGIIALIVWGIKKLTERSDSTHKKDPMDVAKERYAKVEISKAEF